MIDNKHYGYRINPSLITYVVMIPERESLKGRCVSNMYNLKKKLIVFLLVIAMLVSFMPISKEVNAAVGTVETIPADGYFTPSDTFYRYFVPGIMRPDEGTIELRAKIEKAIGEFGNNWDFLFTVVPVQSNVGNTMIGAYIPPAPDTGLTFLIRTGSDLYSMNVPDFTYTPGTAFNLAFTWKAGGFIHIYQNGTEIGIPIAMGNAIKDSILPYNFSVEKFDPFYISKLKISTSELTPTQLSTNPAQNFSANTGTTALISNDMINSTKYVTSWHTSSNYSSLMPAYRTETQTFSVGENVYYPLLSINYAAAQKDYTVQMTVYDPYGNTKLTNSTPLTILNDGQYRVHKIPLNELQTAGLYMINTSIILGGTEIAQYSSAISVLPVNDSTISDGALANYYGQHPSYNYDSSIWKKMNVNVARAWEDGAMFLWSKIEPTKGNFTWEKADSYVAQNKAAGMDILGVLGYPSRWAAEQPDPITDPRPGRWKPRSLEEWGNYVYQTVSRYKGKVKYWEIWNEVNFHPPYLAASFSGSTEEYLLLLKTAYTQAKLADPDSQILISGFSSADIPTADSIMPLTVTNAVYASGYYDIYNVHGYHGAEHVKSWIDNLKVQQPGKKYWMSEYYSYTDPDPVRRTFDTLNSYISFLENGYEKYINMGVPSDNNFINRNTQSPTQVFQAIGVMQSNIRKTNSWVQKYSGFPNEADFSLKHLFSRADGKYLSILGTESTSYDIYINGTIDSVTDVYGNAITPTVTNNVSKIPTSNTVYIVSSQPLQINNVIRTSPEITQFAKNGGFEEITGDPAAGGLESVTPTSWSLKATTYDPAGKIKVSGQSASGNYAVSVKSSGQGRVYVTQDFVVPSPGRYTLTAKYKKVSGDATLQPYMFFFNRDTLQLNQQVINGVSTTSYGTFSMSVDIYKVTKNEAIGLGILSGAGEVLIDDITVTKESLPTQFAQNSGFEKITGDPAVIGLEACIPDYWSLKTTTYDPAGKIVLTSQSAVGNYAISVKSSGQGRVYVTQDYSVPSPGRYTLTAKYKKISGDGTLEPYMFFYNRDTLQLGQTSFSNVSNTEYGTFSFFVDILTVPLKGEAVGLGIYKGAGELLIDDVTITRSDIPFSVIVDNADVSGVTVTGSWGIGTANGLKYATNYLQDQNTGKGTKSVQYTPNIPARGIYEVYMWWPSSASYANNVPISIHTAKGSFNTTVNQQKNGGVWNLLGTYEFNVGTSGNVVISNTGTNGYMIADAVKFEQKTILPEPVTSITVAGAGNETTVLSGKTLAMSATVLPENDLNKSVLWSVVNGTGTAAIDAATGVVTGQQAGTVTVRATAKDSTGVSGELQITVIALQHVTLTADTTILKAADRAALTVTGTMSDGSPADFSNAVVVYSSDNSAASVDGNGVVTATGAGEGTVQIKAAVTLNGTTVEQVISIYVDITPPTIAWEGVVDGQSYTDSVTPAVKAVDTLSGILSLTLKLDGQTWTTGTAITQKGAHTLVANAVDKAGNTTVSKVNFTVYETTSLKVDNSGSTYSNATPLRAVLVDAIGQPLVGETVIFKLDGATIGTVVTDVYGVALLQYKVDVGASPDAVTLDHSLQAVYVQNDALYYRGSSASGILTVGKEDATIAYTGTTVSQLGTAVTLSALVTQQADGSLGKTSGLPVQFTLSIVNPNGSLSPYNFTVDQSMLLTDVNGSVSVAVQLPAGLYRMNVKLMNNSYFKVAESTSDIAVFDVTAGEVKVDGWFTMDTANAIMGSMAKKVHIKSLWGYDDTTLSPEGRMNIQATPGGLKLKMKTAQWLVIAGDSAYVQGQAQDEKGNLYTVRMMMGNNADASKAGQIISLILWEGNSVKGTPTFQAMGQMFSGKIRFERDHQNIGANKSAEYEEIEKDSDS